MITNETFREIALRLSDAVELPHFDKPSFRVKGKIFATLHTADRRAVLKLTPIDQSVFCSYSKDVFYPVAGAWGAKGYTMVNLDKVKVAMLRDALGVAYNGVKTPTKGRTFLLGK